MVKSTVSGHGAGEGECTREFKPKSNEFKKNIIIAKGDTMFKTGDGATADDNIFSSTLMRVRWD